MTDLNLKVKIHVVDVVLDWDNYATRVLLSEKAQKEFEKLRKKKQTEYRRFVGVLDRYAKAGFENFEGDAAPIRYEGGEVYRVGYTSTLFRLIGFFEDDRRDSFVGIDAFRKPGSQLTSGQRDRIKEVASVKRQRRWRIR